MMIRKFYTSNSDCGCTDPPDPIPCVTPLPCPPEQCETKMDMDCIFYHRNNPDAINLLRCLGLPNGVSLTTVVESMAALLCPLTMGLTCNVVIDPNNVNVVMNGTTATITFTYTGVAMALWYQLDGASPSNPPRVTTSVQNPVTIVITDVGPGSHTISLRGQCTNGALSNWVIKNFNAGAGTCAVVITIPTIIPVGQGATIPFTVSGGTAVSFEYELLLFSTTSQGIVAIGSSPIVLTSLPAGAHSIRVRGICSNGVRGDWSADSQFLIVIPFCDIVLTNIGAQENSGFITFDWTDTNGVADLYELTITTPSMVALPPIQSVTKPIIIDKEDFTELGTYTFTVQARCSGNQLWGPVGLGSFIITFVNPIFTPTPNVRVFFGQTPLTTTPDELTIEASLNYIDILNSADVPIDFSVFSTFDYLWVAVPKTQPVLTQWAGITAFANGGVGNLNSIFDAWRAPASSGNSYNYYLSDMKTKYNGVVTFNN